MPDLSSLAAPGARILIRAVNWIGDAVMTTPAMTAIRRQFPQAKITVLANPLVAQLFSPHPAVDRVLVFDRNGRHRGAVGRLRLAAEIRRQRFDGVFILPNSFDSALVPWLARIPCRMGKRSDGRGFMLTHGWSPAAKDMAGHEVEYYLALVRQFGVQAHPMPLHLFTTPEEDRAAEEFLVRRGIPAGARIIGVNPGATFGAAKRWYPERFAEAAERLARQWDAHVLIFGSPNEAPLAAEIERALGGTCTNLAGKTSVRELLAFIKRCSFLITNDSGPMHIAVAFDIPLVAVFGPTDHVGTSPYTERAAIVRKQTDCAPCKLRECPTDHRCMTAITADDVVAAAQDLIKRSP